MPSKGTYRQGGSGKGDKWVKGADRSKVAENLDTIKQNEPKKKVCGSCDGFKGIDILGFTICGNGVKKFNLNKDDECGAWKWLNG